MAGEKIKGFEELVRNTNQISQIILVKALEAAEDAAAAVARQMIEAAAPRKSGQLAASVDVFIGKDKKSLTGSRAPEDFGRSREKEGLLRLLSREGMELEQRAKGENGSRKHS